MTVRFAASRCRLGVDLSPMTSWLVLQLADSAFPTGGFAHSSGLEAHVQAGELASLEQFCIELVDQMAHGSLPIVAGVYDAPERLGELDAFTAATLWNHVTHRASRSQGRALLDVAARSFGNAPLVAARAQLQSLQLEGHLAPAFGFVTRTLGVPREEALATFLHLAVRGTLSAAVRLGICGPTESQALHLRLHGVLDDALARAHTLQVGDVAQTSPLVELLQGTHDRLYARLFQS
jgi:urease accessory protein